MQNSKELKSQIRGFIVENFLYGEDNENLTDESSFLEFGLIDSTGVLELVAFVETELGVAIKDSEMVPENLDSINAIATFVTTRQQNDQGKRS
jgi:acyl carrier protein